MCLTRKITPRVLTIVCITSLGAFAGNPVPTAFVYQGQMKFQDRPYTGDADFAFSLWDAPEGGRELAGAVRAHLFVNDGLFQVELDFGLEPFQRGIALWLDVAVETAAGSARFAPRQAVTPTPFALHSLSAPDAGATGLVLPYSGVANSAQTAFAVGQQGLAGAAGFAIDRTDNAQPALTLSTTGTGPGLLSTTAAGPAIWGRTGVGGGNAGYFETLGVANTQSALAAENKAGGPAAHFRTTKMENTNPALVAETFSDGSAASFTTHDNPNNSNLAPTVASTNESFGSAGRFAVANASSTATALLVETNGGGNAVYAKTGGSGRAAYFEVDNIGTRTVPALEVVTNGRGAGAGLFQTTSQLNTATALVAESAGNAGAIRGTARGHGAAVIGSNAFGGDAVVGTVEGSSGRAGEFTSTDPANADPALEAVTGGPGPAARFENTMPDGQAGEFVGDVSVNGVVKADSFQYRSPQTHHLSLTPFDFTPNDGKQDWSRFAGPLGGVDIGAGAQSDGSIPGDQNFMCAPVHLPEGATVTGVVVHYYYIRPDFNVRELKVVLYRRLLWNGLDSPMATLQAGNFAEDGLHSMETSEITDPLVDNLDHGYWVFAGLINPCETDNPDFPCVQQPVYGVVISYTVPEPD